jgi:hypothetical protein
MNCQLFYHLQQMAYLANIKSEFAEEERYKTEMLTHTRDCPFCNGFVPGELAENLFGGLVIVTASPVPVPEPDPGDPTEWR